MFREEDEDDDIKKRKRPKTRPAVDKGGSGQPPRPTAIGLSGDGEDERGFVRGQIVKCKVLAEAVRGFEVELLGMRITGRLHTEQFHSFGEVIEASFDHWGPDGKPVFTPFSMKELERLVQRDISNFLPDGRETGFEDVFGRLRTEHYPFEQQKLRYNRAVDFFVPALETSEVMHHESGPSVFRQLIPQMIAIEYTGVLLASNDQFVSRGAILVSRGRVVGAVYANNFQTRVDDLSSNLRSILTELLDKGTSLTSYTLPEEIILPYASLFLGSKLESDEESRGKDYAKVMIDSFKNEAVTGVISLSLSFGIETCLILFNSGVYSGYFLVQERRFSNSAFNLDDDIAKNITGIDTRVLHNELIESGKPIGLMFLDFAPKIY